MAVTNFYLTNFMNRMKDGARNNQFAVDITLPPALQGVIVDGTNAQNKFRFQAKGSALPASTTGEIVIPFRGAQYKIPGDRTFADWTVTVMNDTDFLIRDALEQWSDLTTGHVNHDRYGEETETLNYMGTGIVQQLSRNNEVLKDYTIVGIWPKEISDIQLDWGSNDQIEEFSVTFAIQWWESNTTRNNTSAQLFERTGGSVI